MPSNRPILAVNNLHASYGDVRALFGVSVEVNEGEIVAVVGANGAGKTTLLNSISGILPVLDGHISFAGRLVSGFAPHERVAAGIAHVPEGGRLFTNMTVLENLEMGSYLRAARMRRKESFQRVFHLLPRLDERKHQNAATLSGGERQMLSIGRALMARPKLLLLDEPSLGLAPILVEQLFETIKEISAGGVTILIVEQNLRKTLTMADRGYVIETGRIVASGSGQALLDDDQTRRAYMGL